MHLIRNNRTLSKQLVAKVEVSVVIMDLKGAAEFLRKFDNDDLHWRAAGRAIEEADADPTLLDHATASVEKALRTRQMLWRV
jgi:hypothetical protein